MSTSLDDLRIDRRPGPHAAQRPWIIIISLLLLGAILIGGAFWWKHGSSAIQVKTEAARAVVSGGAKTLLNASGYVTARRAATVSSKVMGKVVELKVEEGMKVDAGQILARLDASNVEANLHLAEAQLISAKAQMEETRPNLTFARQELSLKMSVA